MLKLIYYFSLFKMVHDGRSLRGRSNDAIASACLYIACRQEGKKIFAPICIKP